MSDLTGLGFRHSSFNLDELRCTATSSSSENDRAGYLSSSIEDLGFVGLLNLHWHSCELDHRKPPTASNAWHLKSGAYVKTQYVEF